jgi:hypothetical protein
VAGQIGFGWEIGDGFTTGLYSNITITDITYTSTIVDSPSTFSASASSTATVTHTMWSSNISGSFVNGSWTAWTGNPITYTTTLGAQSGTINTITLYVNDSLGTVGSNTVSLELSTLAETSLVDTFSIIYIAAPLLALVFLALVGVGTIKMDNSTIMVAVIVGVVIVVGLTVAFAVMSAVTNVNIVN